MNFRKILSLLILSALLSCTASHKIVVKDQPAAPVAVRPAQPGPDYVWVDGDWYVVKGKYTYRNGYWVKPRKSKVWVPGHWQNTPGGYYWVPGHWS